MKSAFSNIGRPVIREDGYEKVTGLAKFADDYRYEGMLYGVMVRVPSSHAFIDSIDFSEIENDDNISAVYTADDIPGLKKVGMLKYDQPVFCNEKVVTPGDVVAMIVGPSEKQLRLLRDKVKVNYTELPRITDPLRSLEKDAILIHPESGSNLINHYPLRKGNVEKGFAESEFILEQTYSTQFIEHAYIEPEAVIAVPLGPVKGVEIIGSIQNPFTARRIVAAVLDYPLAKVIVKQAQLGGSFGGKDDTMDILSARAAIAAVKTGRPVKIRYAREDSILESYKRHPYVMNYKVGYDRSGKINAMKIDIIADGGAYASMSPFVTWRSVVQATGPYEIENVHTDVKAVYTNNPYTGAMRGFGSPQPVFAQESIMDEIARKLNMSPAEIRRINGLRTGSVTASGQKLKDHDVNLLTVLEKGIAISGFEKKYNEYSGQKKIEFGFNRETFLVGDSDFVNPADVLKKGIGLAISYRGCSLGAEGIDAAAAYLSVQNDGSIYLLSGVAENGQGLRTTLSIIAAEVFSISTERVFYLDLSTANVPDSGPTVASRSTLMGGGAVQNAADTIKERLVGFIREEWKLEKNSAVEFYGGKIIEGNSGTELCTFDELCKRAYNRGVNLSVIGWYKSPEVSWDEETGQGDAYFTYVYGCQIAEVTVNTITGEVYLNKLTAVHDPGTVINKLGAEGQVYGGVTQGMGYGLMEEISAEDGFIRELNFDQYLIPTSKDIDEIIPVFIEGRDIYGAWGAKSLGEPTLELTAAAIANAVCNATGKRFFNLPLNLEELILSKKLKPANLQRGSLQ